MLIKLELCLSCYKSYSNDHFGTLIEQKFPFFLFLMKFIQNYGGCIMEKVSVDKILDRIYECGAEPQIIQDMNLSDNDLFHIYSRIKEASLKGSSPSLVDVFKMIYSRD